MNSHSLPAEVSHGEANKLSLLSVLPRCERPLLAGKNSQKTTVKQSLQVLNVDWQFCFRAFAYLPGGVLPYKRLMGMCRWMGSHFHDWIDYNGVTFLVEFLEWGCTFRDFWDKKILVAGI